jgi:signal transduction histidine kinase
LAPALESLTRSSALPLDVTYSADDLPDHVSLTAYYVASEGVANAVKHARGIPGRRRRAPGGVRRPRRRARRRARRRPPHARLGAAMLSDRVNALGGRLTVSSEPRGGTSIEAVIPCAS